MFCQNKSPPEKCTAFDADSQECLIRSALAYRTGRLYNTFSMQRVGRIMCSFINNYYYFCDVNGNPELPFVAC